ncbi:hypothetical protein BH10ACT11_BH10ACT11_04010 [soil metagenome]
MDLVLAGIFGLVGGFIGGIVGVGGGILFVPALVIFLDESQVKAEATSLMAIALVVAVGARRQAGYGNVRLRDGLTIGGLAAAGAIGGVALSNILPERALQVGFAILALFVAAQLAYRALKTPSPDAA